MWRGSTNRGFINVGTHWWKTKSNVYKIKWKNGNRQADFEINVKGKKKLRIAKTWTKVRGLDSLATKFVIIKIREYSSTVIWLIELNKEHWNILTHKKLDT